MRTGILVSTRLTALPLRLLALFLLPGAGLLAGCETAPDVARDAGPVDAGPPADAGVDSGPPDAGPPPVVCPPTGPYASGVGAIGRDVTLLDCDGNEHSLHELCESEAIWIFEYAEWCPPCRAFARDSANPIYANVRDRGVSAWMVISEDGNFDPPSATVCSEIRDRYGIEMPVLIDPEGLIQSTFGVAPNEVHIVMSAGNRIEWKGHYAGSQVESQIERVLAE